MSKCMQSKLQKKYTIDKNYLYFLQSKIKFQVTHPNRINKSTHAEKTLVFFFYFWNYINFCAQFKIHVVTRWKKINSFFCHRPFFAFVLYDVQNEEIRIRINQTPLFKILLVPRIKDSITEIEGGKNFTC